VEATPDHHEKILSDEELEVRVVRRAREVVRVRKRIITEEQTVTVRTRREELVVERRPATASDRVDEEGPTSSLDHVFTLSAEEVTVQTRTVPKERVRVWVEPVVDQRVLSADLRHEDLAVELDGEVRI
jgi:uncharacterized protein (TIGR02271 family)